MGADGDTRSGSTRTSGGSEESRIWGDGEFPRNAEVDCA